MTDISPQTYSDPRIDARAREVWWLCSERIKQVLEKPATPETAALLQGLGACASGMGVVIQDEQADGEEFGE